MGIIPQHFHPSPFLCKGFFIYLINSKILHPRGKASAVIRAAVASQVFFTAKFDKNQ